MAQPVSTQTITQDALDALLWTHNGEANRFWHNKVNGETVLTYYFFDKDTSAPIISSIKASSQMSEDEKTAFEDRLKDCIALASYQTDAVKSVLQSMQDMINVKFEPAATADKADIVFTIASPTVSERNVFGQSTNLFNVDGSIQKSIIFFDPNHLSGSNSWGKGSIGIETAIHEVCHALGLKDMSQGSYRFGRDPEAKPDEPDNLQPHKDFPTNMDNTFYTVMAYNRSVGSARVDSLMASDIEALQALYGERIFYGQQVYNAGTLGLASTSSHVRNTIWDSSISGNEINLSDLNLSFVDSKSAGFYIDLRDDGYGCIQSAIEMMDMGVFKAPNSLTLDPMEKQRELLCI